MVKENSNWNDGHDIYKQEGELRHLARLASKSRVNQISFIDHAIADCRRQTEATMAPNVWGAKWPKGHG